MSLCPICKEGDIVEEDKLFHCSNQSSEFKDNQWVENGTCQFKAFKNAFVNLNGPELTIDLLNEIIENGEAKIDLISKAGKPYKAYAVLDPKWGVKIDFSRPKEG